MSLNRAQIIGNITRDPEIRQIPGGQTVATFGVATNFTWTDSNGQKQEKVEFHNIVAWRKLAEIVGQFLKKGSKVFVEGRLQTREWEGEDGIKRYRTEIIADNVIMLDRKGTMIDGAAVASSFEGSSRRQGTVRPANNMDSAEASSRESSQENRAAEMSAVAAGSEEVTIDDLPF